MILKAVCTVLGDLLERISKLFVGKRTALVKQVAKIAEYLFDRFDVPLVAVDKQLIAAGADADIEERFEIFDVLILDAEKRVQSLGW